MVSLKRQKRYHALLAEYGSWCDGQGLELGSPDEHIDDEGLTRAQRAWIRDFVVRWLNVEREAVI